MFEEEDDPEAAFDETVETSSDLNPLAPHSMIISSSTITQETEDLPEQPLTHRNGSNIYGEFYYIFSQDLVLTLLW
jgi:hypothetical protein